MMHWWRRSIAAQFIALTMLALFGSQALSLLVSLDEREKLAAAAAKSEFFSRTAAVARLAEVIPASALATGLAASETGNARFWISPDEPTDAGDWRVGAVAELQRPLPDIANMQQHYGRAIPSATTNIDPAKVAVDDSAQPWLSLPPAFWTSAQPAKFTYLGHDEGYGLTVELADGSWLNAAFYQGPVASPWWTSRAVVTMFISALVLSLVGFVIARQIAKPLRQLAAAAEALGRGETVSPLPENGPDDVRQTAAAFNTMQLRLRRFVADRTRMLAAIGHDLRTPLTSLRLRVEFVADQELRDRILASIEEIRTMTEATIALAKGEATHEETRPADLDSLLGSLCEDLAELGEPVNYREGIRTICRCRPDGLKRAVRNLIENAVRYGGSADVYIQQGTSTTDFVVEDRGPGIPDAMVEQVFAPFFRLETSRNRETGGVGLGLAIARAIVHQHGGEIVLSNNRPGLKATLSLPRSEAAPGKSSRRQVTLAE